MLYFYLGDRYKKLEISSIYKPAVIAQLVERWIGDLQVPSSILGHGLIFENYF
jgi:hypothetical protein